jgi:hypothetical protein
MTSAKRRPGQPDGPPRPASDAEEADVDELFVESLIESFPASDPPSRTALMRVGPPKRKDARGDGR